MKTNFFLILLLIFSIDFSKAQILTTPPIPGNPREWNENYMETYFVDEFKGTTLKPENWDIMTGPMRSGQLQNFKNNILNVSVESDSLKLTAVYSPNNLDSIWTSDGYIPSYKNYTSGEIWSDLKFGYGSFECLLKYPNVYGTFPAFLKYRLNTTWLNYHESRLHYGLKLSYSIKF